MTVTEQEAERIKRERDDRAMLLNPLIWPNWPLLPLKRNRKDSESGWPIECGLVIAVAEQERWRIYKTNMFSISSLPGSTLAEKITENSKIDRYVYESVDALLADGWEVD